jgi:hypothetical protein
MSRTYTLGDAPPAAPAAPAAAPIERAYKLVVNQTLAQNAAFADLRAAIDSDGDFIITDVYGSSTGPFSIKFRDAGMKDLSSAEINSANAIGTAQFPVEYGAVRYRALGQLSYSITNLYAGSNVIQLVLSGFRVSQQG